MNIAFIGFGSMGRTRSYAVMSLPFYDKNLPLSSAGRGGVPFGHFRQNGTGERL